MYIVYLELYVLAECRAVGGERVANLHAAQLVFADIECAPYVVHHRDAHDGRAQSHEFSHLGINLAHLALYLCHLHRLAQQRAHHIHSVAGGLCVHRSHLTLLFAGSVLSHFILALGSLYLCFGRLVRGKGFITLLSAYDALVVEVLHAVIGFLGYLAGSLGLLHQLVGTLYLLLACSGVGEVLERLGRFACGLGHSLLGVHLGHLEYGERIAYMHKVALLDSEFYHAAGQFARHPVFRHFDLALDNLRFLAEGEIADEGHDDHHCRKPYDGKQYVVMLCFS